MNNLAVLSNSLPTAVAVRAVLARAVDIAANVTEKRNTYSILGNVRLTGDGQTMFVISTDLDIEIVVAVPAAADTDFDVTVPAHMMKALLKSAPPAEHVAMTAPLALGPIPGATEHATFDGKVLLEFERVEYSLAAIHPETWPEFATRAPVTRFSMPGAMFLDGLNSVAFAISTEETRYYLNGVYMHTDGAGVLTFIATDGHRLARQSYPGIEGAERAAGILPTKLVKLCQKLLKGSVPETVTIETAETSIRIAFDDVTITAKLIEGTFPDYERVTPKQNDRFVTTSIADMLEAIKAVSLIKSTRGGPAARLVTGSECLTLSTSSPEGNSAWMTISAALAEEHAGLEIGFNASYLADICSNLGTDCTEVVMALGGPSGPAVFTGAREGWTAVLMPMRV